MGRQPAIRIVIPALALALLLAPVAGAAAAEKLRPAESTPTPASADQDSGWTKVTVAGMQVAIDEHGRLRPPTAEEAKALAQAFRMQFRRSAQARPTVEYRDGHMSAVVGMDHLDYTVLSVEPDGSLSLSCVDGVDQAVAAFTGTAHQPEEE
jgi:hypothetical protein